VAGLLAGCPAREVLMTCISELCTNAIAHTASGNGGVFTVEVELPQDGVARISVTDDGGPSLPAAASLDPASLDSAASLDPAAASLDPAAASLDPASLDSAASLDLMAEGGRGLALVAACTGRWGYIDAHPGRTVWAEACWPVPVASPDQDASRNASRWHRRFSPVPPGDWPSGPAA